ncbi:hypothetical protein O0L34_g18652 [Tuta absoluta]|nr:hypothetical protein O0L34_g18652 [Tuta absoluta]
MFAGHSPPKLSAFTEETNKNSKSESDISSAVFHSEYVNNNSRNKRTRLDRSPEGMSGQNNQNSSGLTIAEFMERQSTLIEKLVLDVSVIKKQNEDIQKSNQSIENSMTFLNDKYEAMKIQMETLQKDCQTQFEYIKHLENKIQDLQYKSRSSGIEIRNIPSIEGENWASLANTVTTIGNIVGHPVPESQIRDIYRLPGKPNTVRPIIAEFATVKSKQELLSAVRKHNQTAEKRENKLNTQLMGIQGNLQAVYVSDQLPGSTKRLFRLARDFAKTENYKF